MNVFVADAWKMWQAENGRHHVVGVLPAMELLIIVRWIYLKKLNILEEMNMKLDRTFQNDVKKVFKNCERFDCIKKMQRVTELLSNRYQYDNAIRDYGRGIVSVCTSVAVLYNITEYESPERTWAQEVINLLDDSERRIAKTFGNFWLHPAILADNMNLLRKVTTQN